MNPQQKAYAEKISYLRDYINKTTAILDKLIRECNHLIVEMKDFGGAYCDICGESFGWYCEKSPTKYCEYSAGEYGEVNSFIECKHCGQPRSRK
jgi:hypothetical protein